MTPLCPFAFRPTLTNASPSDLSTCCSAERLFVGHRGVIYPKYQHRSHPKDERTFATQDTCMSFPSHRANNELHTSWHISYPSQMVVLRLYGICLLPPLFVERCESCHAQRLCCHHPTWYLDHRRQIPRTMFRGPWHRPFGNCHCSAQSFGSAAAKASLSEGREEGIVGSIDRRGKAAGRRGPTIHHGR